MAREKKPRPRTIEATFPEVWEMLDKQRIINEILTTPFTITECDFEDAKAMVYDVAGRWLLRDLEDFNIDSKNGIEHLFEWEVDNKPFLKGYLDIFGEVAQPPGSNPFAEFAGLPFSVDWKTSNRDLNDVWAARYLNSWQWRLYAAARDLKLFIYRGIKRPQKVGEKTAFREIPIAVPSYNFEECMLYVAALLASRQALVDGRFEIWPQSRPDACKAYNRDCPFLDDCDQFTMPRAAIGEKVMSYSSLKDFARCPEYHRRAELQKLAALEDADAISGAEANFGTLVHSGVAEVYRQALALTL